MKIREIRELSSEELKKRIVEEEDNLVDLRFSKELKQLTNTAKISNTKKLIARMHTVLNEKNKISDSNNIVTEESK